MEDVVSVSARRRVWITEPELQNAPAIANARPSVVPAAPACAERSKCGPSITRMPMKPAVTADQR